MRLPESKLREAILHREEELRVRAVSYFSRPPTRDESVMSLVIEAVEKYGRGFAILRAADDLPQTAATIQWLSDELRKGWDLADLGNDNYCCAVALLLGCADPRLLGPEIAELPCFPEELRDSFRERLEMATWDWETAWAAFEQFGREMRRRGHARLCDLRRARRFVEALGRHHDKAKAIMPLLERRYRGGDRSLMEWLEPFLAETAGRMGLDEATPILVERLHEDDLSLPNSCWIALCRISNDRVVETIAEHWKDGSPHFRNYATDVLEHIHTDLSVKKCLEFLSAEENFDTRISLANALLGNFAEEAVEPVRRLVRKDRLDPDELDLRYRLVAACTVMGITFPEYDEWYKMAEQTAWGDPGLPRGRIRRNFRPDLDDLDPGWGERQQPTRRLRERPSPGLLHGNADPPAGMEAGRKPAGRNDPCPCGSGKKFKKCCLKKQNGNPLLD